eukprot:GHVU01197318.1.p1 GENE.GHVU01197318.1~~GHVU01197318.1.p1  ORF type:complete len:175 (-),score=30.14 GHVU01197318.1:656-1180(-)
MHRPWMSESENKNSASTAVAVTEEGGTITAGDSANAATGAEPPPSMPAANPLVQYIVLPLSLAKQWPLGALVAQACHASVAAIAVHVPPRASRDVASDANVDAYLSDLDCMRKVVLSVPDTDALVAVSQKLEAAAVPHKLWVEQPENLPTCIATKPAPKAEVFPLLKHLKLLKL